MEFSAKGLELLTAWEGSRDRIYLDAAGYPTIGVGHLLTRSERSSGRISIDNRQVDVRTRPLSPTQITALLAQDVEPAENAVNQLIDRMKSPAKLNQHQFDALVSFAFNIGVFAFRNSTLCRVLAAGDYEIVPLQLIKWTHAGGRIVQGLINRRQKEIQLWLGRL